VIFGKKAEDTMDASLRVPPGVAGKIIGVRMFVRREKMATKEENAGFGDRIAYETLTEDAREDRKARMAHVENLKETKKLTAREVEDEKEKVKLYCQSKEQQLRLEMAREKENLNWAMSFRLRSTKS